MKSEILNIVKRAGNNSIFSSFINLSSIQVSNVLLLILLHPILNRKIGDAYGMTMVVNSFAILIGIIVNYGTNQSGIKDIALAKNDKVLRAHEFYKVLFVRLVIFAFFFALLLFANSLDIPNYSFFFMATPLIFAEVLNPLFLYIGIERLSMFNFINICVKTGIILAVIFLINGKEDAEWVNFYMGAIHILGYLILTIYGLIKFDLFPKNVSQLNYKILLKNNFYLVCSSLSAHLQQSFMLFALAKWGSAGWLYAYSIGDKIIWSIRILIISITNAIYPKAAVIYNNSREDFLQMKFKYNRFLGYCFGGISLALLVFAPLIIKLWTGDYNQTAILFLRLMSLSPLLAALNALNIIHLLISNQNKEILKIGVFLMLTSAILGSGVIYSQNLISIGIYAILMESIALLYYTKSLAKHNMEFTAGK